MIQEVALQALKAAAYYVLLLLLMRAAGKRLAGQTTTFDLIILITLGVVLQQALLGSGVTQAAVFVVTVFVLHRAVAGLCAQYEWFRHLVRGKPRVLVRDGKVEDRALREEGISESELIAGLRKLGYEGPEKVKIATLEETGHISAVAAH